jgi:biotin-dependent carboxylase-like uncharacterized protein
VLVVDRTGAQALLQDLGRERHAHLGVSPSGAADRAALRLANRLVGNPEDAAAIECVLGGLVVTASAMHWVAVTGAPTEVLVNGTRVGSHTSLPLRPGHTLTIEAPREGLRSYLAVRGGIRAPTTLGSRSTDVLSGLGPKPLVPGTQLPVGDPHHPLPDTDQAPVERPRTTLAVLPGPRRDWFTDDAWRTLLTTQWQVSSDTNRVAVRLDGEPLERSTTEELPSEAMVRGAIQVPSSGQPLIFGPDHPVTGGYPVIAVLTDRDADHAGQLRPGGTVRFALARDPLPGSPRHR